MKIAPKRPTVSQGFIPSWKFVLKIGVLVFFLRELYLLGSYDFPQQPPQIGLVYSVSTAPVFEVTSTSTSNSTSGRSSHAVPSVQSDTVSTSGRSSHAVPSVQSDTVLRSMDLPVRNENGVVIVFIHVGKTGGTTIGAHLGQATHRVHNGWTLQGYRKASRGLETALANWTKGDSHTFELHAATAPPYMTILPRIDIWRQRCEELDVPFFAFTVLRNPSKLAMSFFNFYHGGKHRKFKNFKTATEAQFLNHTIDNPQCMFLARGEMSYHPGNEHLRQNLTKSECNSVYDALAKHLDWIGTTETLLTMTLPILERVTNATFDKGKIVNEVKAEHKNILWSDLTEEGKQTVQDMTDHDLDMWDRCQAEYKLSMWKDFS
jgi:hypothetical protein